MYYGRGRHRRGPWPPPWMFGWSGAGPRVRRGDVRAAILALLAEGPMHGYEMIQELDARTEGLWRPSAGSIYPTLQLLEDEGFVRSDEGGDRRRFSLTDAGRAVVDERQGPPPWEEVGHGPGGGGAHARQLGEAGFQIAGAVMHASATANEEQVAKIREILVDARKRIYDVLGEDTEA